MKSTVAFSAGFAAGWIARSAVHSSRDAAVTLLAFCIDAIERIRRIVAIERERFEDLIAEARVRAQDRGSATEPPLDPPLERAA